MPNNISKSSPTLLSCIKCNADAPTFINRRTIGMVKGNASIDTSKALPPSDSPDTEDTKVITVESPMIPNAAALTNNGKS